MVGPQFVGERGNARPKPALVTMNMNDQEKVRCLYPDILDGGGLLSVVRALFGTRIVSIRISGFGTGQNYARIELADKSSQIFLLLDQRDFSFDFWRVGQKQASGTTPNLQAVIASIEHWVTGDGDVDALVRAYPFVLPHKRKRVTHWREPS